MQTQYGKLVEHNIVIRSSDRDLTQYPNPNEYKIVTKDYKEIVEFELTGGILPFVEDINLEPYILVQINEFKQNLESSNKILDDTFSILQLAGPVTPTSPFINIDKRISEQTVLKLQTPQAKLETITIKIKKWDGTLFDFGTDSATGNYPFNPALQNLFTFKITTIEQDFQKLNHQFSV